MESLVLRKWNCCKISTAWCWFCVTPWPKTLFCRQHCIAVIEIPLMSWWGVEDKYFGSNSPLDYTISALTSVELVHSYGMKSVFSFYVNADTMPILLWYHFRLFFFFLNCSISSGSCCFLPPSCCRGLLSLPSLFLVVPREKLICILFFGIPGKASYTQPLDNFLCADSCLEYLFFSFCLKQRLCRALTHSSLWDHVYVFSDSAIDQVVKINPDYLFLLHVLHMLKNIMCPRHVQHHFQFWVLSWEGCCWIEAI